jgi:cytochrome c oxidase subunit II
MTAINLAADYGWGPHTLLIIFIMTVIVTTIGFFIVMATTKSKNKQSFSSKSKYHPEAFWAIGVTVILIWLWVISYPWMPPVASSSITKSVPIQVVDVTAGQWFWLMNRVDQQPQGIHPGDTPRVTVVANQPVKFVAHSIDVNHGFGIFAGSNDGAPILLQMQVIPKVENVFYYTFKHPGTYFIRCLEYCGMAHPYMISEIKVISPTLQQQNSIKNNPTNTTLYNPSTQI